MRRYSEIEHLLKLSLAVYRVTELFPETEPLRFQIRESANNILADLLLNCDEKCSRHIMEIVGLFDLAEEKNWVDSRNFLVLKREYNKVGHRMSNLSENSYLEPGSKQSNHRHEKILEVINGNGMVKIGDLIKLFPGINRRTVLRDLDKLCQDGAAIRNGNGRGAHYIYNGHK